MNPAYTALWIAWLSSFFIIEGAALARKEKGDTLSEHLRLWLGTQKNSPGILRMFGVTGFSLFALWFIPHILFDPN